jgi:enoyl-CoA hydratase
MLPAVAEHLSIEQQGRIGLIRLDRPPANAMDLDLLREIPEALDEIAATDAGAFVLTGRPGFFSAGLDLKVAPTLDTAGQDEMVMGVNRMAATLYGLDRPLVAAVTGHAIAGGLIAALCADYRVGSTEGKLGLTELRVGVPYPACAIAVVNAELSAPVARRLALEANLIEPPEALAWQIVDELVAPDAVLSRALEVAEELAAMPAQAYAIVKRQIRGAQADEMRRIVEEEDDPLLGKWLAGEAADAAAAVLRGDS